MHKPQCFTTVLYTLASKKNQKPFTWKPYTMNHIKPLRKLPLMLLLLGTALFFNSCKKVDELLDLAPDFGGIFANSIGWEVALYEPETGHAKYSKAGTPVPGFSVFTSFAYDMEKVDDDSWPVMVRNLREII